MEKACIAYVSLDDEQIAQLRPFAEMYYSAAILQRNYTVIVREKALTENQFRSHILRMLRKHKIATPRLKRNWLQTIPETEARDLITKLQREPSDDSRIFVLSRPCT